MRTGKQDSSAKDDTTKAKKGRKAKADVPKGDSGGAGPDSPNKNSAAAEALETFGKGLAVVVASPIVLAGAAIFTAGAIVYGAGKILEGVGKGLAAGPQAAYNAAAKDSDNEQAETDDEQTDVDD